MSVQPEQAPTNFQGMKNSAGDFKMGENKLLATYRKSGKLVMQIFRMDLQLHFFWGFFLTLSGLYWPPFFAAGMVVTVVKEFLDLWSKKHWSWGDFYCGMAGSALALVFSFSLY